MDFSDAYFFTSLRAVPSAMAPYQIRGCLALSSQLSASSLFQHFEDFWGDVAFDGFFPAIWAG